MGRNAKLRKNRNNHLPESWWSETHGHVDRDNFKGCKVVHWDFAGDAPVVLVNETTFQIHTNLAYCPENLEGLMTDELLKDHDFKRGDFEFSKTSF